MKALYIGILTSGTTSRMRAEVLRKLKPDWHWDWVDTDEPMRGSSRIWRSLAFRYKTGLAVTRINSLVGNALSEKGVYDLIWVDKGVFLTRSTMACMRNVAGKIVHFTPDTAFSANRSRHFTGSLKLYDLLVTTKSLEIEDFRKRGVGDRLLLTTQGYDATLHRPEDSQQSRTREVVFVGLAEPEREVCLAEMLRAGIPVRLGGRGWESFLRRHEGFAHLRFEGPAVFGEDYVRLLSNAWVGLGLLSKRFPELHTTRTFEIPACGGILATERTTDTERFFEPDEALFFDDYPSLASRLGSLFAGNSDEKLARIARAGHDRTVRDRRNYDCILSDVLSNLGL